MIPIRLKFILSLLIIIVINQTHAQTQFAVIGDYGEAGSDEEAVANLVNSWNVDFIITTGDNSYTSTPIDVNIGQYYSYWIGNYNGSYGSGSPINKFFPSIGNHDYSDGGGLNAYLNYFTLPGISGNSSGDEKYYDYIIDNIHFFAINSITDITVQETWLQTQMISCDQNHSHWRLVYFHHPPYSSGDHGSTTRMRWDFLNWGADAILSGHDHDYERLEVDGLVYFVNGVGGRSIRNFGSINSNSVFRYNGDFGAQKVTVNGNEMTFEFYNINGDLIDSWMIQQSSPDITPPQLQAAAINNATQVNLYFSEPLDSQSAQNQSNYSIDNGINVISAILNSNNRDVTLTTSAHNYNQQYTVTVSIVTDLAGNTISSQANSVQYLLESDTTPPELLSVTINNLTEVELFFSESLDFQSAQNQSNYSINNGINVISAILNSNNRDVTLTTSAHNYNQLYTVTVSNVIDIAGNTISSQANSATYSYDSSGTGDLYKQFIASAFANDWYQNYLPERSIDGVVNSNSESRWAGAIPMPDSIIFDLGSPRTLSKTRIAFYEWNTGRIYEYSLKFSNDLGNWQTIFDSKSSSNIEWSEETFSPVVGRYLLLISLSNNQSVWAGVWEAEIWGPDQPTGVETQSGVPTDYELSQNFPNPFNPLTNISFSLPKESIVKITVFNLLGQQVAELVNSYFASGSHKISFNASEFTSGIYFYRMEAGEFLSIKKMTLMK